MTQRNDDLSPQSPVTPRPVDRVPDPTATIPYRRPTDEETMDLAERRERAPAPRRSQTRQSILHLPSLLLGFSAGVLLSASIFGVFFALFTSLT